MSIQNKIIREKIFEKHYSGIIRGFKFSVLPTDILPTDIIDLEKNDREFSENNSWDDHTNLIVYRERLETDKEVIERIEKISEAIERNRKARYEQYLKLKEEFENN